MQKQPDQPIEELKQIPCPYCQGGIAGHITWEMATDAGFGPEAIGQPIHCAYCGGDGWIVEAEGVTAAETGRDAGRAAAVRGD